MSNDEAILLPRSSVASSHANFSGLGVTDKVLGGQRGSKRHPQFVLHARNAVENSGSLPKGFPLSPTVQVPVDGQV